ncbi:hypothetical protein HMPREF9303_1290 [Prevotella denticola CRIS 18C-A]|uniref:Uncharacterized protein n=1 Tax=Prevotella denticola CRIS 18C-A TaxID=944557 RepID=F0H760_9BACT|nr:hypothetical protein HMPREF9303_1290 [Prevotella denticola CRIS 18C-A]
MSGLKNNFTFWTGNILSYPVAGAFPERKTDAGIVTGRFLGSY